MGMVSEADVIRYMEHSPGADPEELRTAAVAAIMHSPVYCLQAQDTLDEAAKTFEQCGLKVAPVLNEQGQYQGLLTRSDLMAALFGTVAPSRIGGLATPLGVYLTTGGQRGGAGDLGLVLTGVALTLMYYLARGAVNGLAWLVERYSSFPLFTAKLAADHGTGMGFFAPSYLWTLLLMAAEMGGFFLLLRLSPISGIHASEHQTVHAIEQGEELIPERVRLLPRVHPRCGTNMMALAFILLIGASAFTTFMERMALQGGPGGVMLGILIIFLAASIAWRRLGAGLQRHITTKQATPRQLANGIAAGKQLLARYREHPSGRVPAWRRLFNMGIAQVAIGFAAATTVVDYLSHLLGLGL